MSSCPISHGWASRNYSPGILFPSAEARTAASLLGYCEIGVTRSQESFRFVADVSVAIYRRVTVGCQPLPWFVSPSSNRCLYTPRYYMDPAGLEPATSAVSRRCSPD